jgi:hypothetical protein
MCSNQRINSGGVLTNENCELLETDYTWLAAVQRPTQAEYFSLAL